MICPRYVMTLPLRVMIDKGMTGVCPTAAISAAHNEACQTVDCLQDKLDRKEHDISR